MKYFYSLSLCFFLFACQAQTLNWGDINAEISKKYPDVTHISIEEFRQLDESEILVVDVREPEEYAVSHLPGAINLNNVDDISELLSNSQRHVVVYCSVGYRSADIARKLSDSNIAEVSNLQGSIFAWANNGLPLVNKEGETRFVHPFNDYWGQLLNDNVPTAK